MPVRRRIHHRLGGDIGGGARPVLDDEGLAETLGQPLSDQPRHYVGSAAGRMRRPSAPAALDTSAPPQFA
jgi:hypothetical protein